MARTQVNTKFRLIILAASSMAVTTLATSGLAEMITGDPLAELLSAGDFVPGRPSLDEAAGSSAEVDLQTLAADDSGATDTGIRLRAIRALSQYPDAETTTVLADIIAQHNGASGADTLFLRAALEALAAVDGADAVATIAPSLDHPSRDVRAGAARALATTGTILAIPILRQRLGDEPTLQVRLAISSAIRKLTDGPEI